MKCLNPNAQSSRFCTPSRYVHFLMVIVNFSIFKEATLVGVIGSQELT